VAAYQFYVGNVYVYELELSLLLLHFFSLMSTMGSLEDCPTGFLLLLQWCPLGFKAKVCQKDNFSVWIF
jgi:hypothetical protein